MSYFRRTLCFMALLLGATCMAGWSVVQWAGQASRESALRKTECLALISRAEMKEQELEKQRTASSEIHRFLTKWEPYLGRISPEGDVAAAMRTTLETLAQRKLSLVTDQITVPEAGLVMFGKRSLRVQRLSMRASGESLVSLIAWVGEAEANFPLARVESLELSSTGGLGLSLKLRLAHPTYPFLQAQAAR